MNEKIKFKNSKLTFLLESIKEIGYSKAVDEFIKKYPSDKYRFDKLEGNLAFRSINENNKNCLIINSDLGNIPDFFSDIYEKIVSLDTPEKIFTTKIEIKENLTIEEINNIIKPFDLINEQKNIAQKLIQSLYKIKYMYILYAY